MSGHAPDRPGGPAHDAASWDARYAQAAQDSGSVWSLTPNATVASLLADAEPGTAVDLGAGEGRNAIWLAGRGWDVTAVDFSEAGLATGRTRAERLGLTLAWVRADVTTWSPPGPVDLVLLAYLQLPGQVLRGVLERATTWLAPGGRLVVVGHDLDNLTRGYGGPQDPDVLHTTDLLAAGAASLTIDRCDQVTRPVDTDDGPRHAIDTVLDAHRT